MTAVTKFHSQNRIRKNCEAREERQWSEGRGKRWDSEFECVKHGTGSDLQAQVFIYAQKRHPASVRYGSTMLAAYN